jgi:hypothetical protein
MGKYSYMQLSSYPKPIELDNSGAVRFDGKAWWLLNHRRKGWASFGYPYSTMQALLKQWNIRLGEQQVDEHGVYFPFE